MSLLLQCAFVIVVAIGSLVLFAGGGLGRLMEIADQIIRTAIDVVMWLRGAIVKLWTMRRSGRRDE